MDASKLQELEEELWIRETRFDVRRMKELLTENFTEIGRSGKIYEVSDTLAIPDQPIDAELPLSDFKVSIISESVAQVTYNSAVKYDGKTQYARRSSIWIFSNGSWKLRFHQGTPYDPSD